jgi:hypothetical protein
MRHAHTRLVSAAVICFGLAVAPTHPVRGQDVAQPPSAGESPPGAGVLQPPTTLSGGPLQPVTVEHQGRLLVLTYGPKPGAGGLASPTSARGKPPRFAVYQGQRQIAAGQFEYG